MSLKIEQNVSDALARLQGNDAYKVLNAALTKSVRILRKETNRNFKAGRTKHGRKINMKTAGLVSVSKSKRKALEKKVHIMKLPLARIFEIGTAERFAPIKRKKHRYTVIDGRGDKVKKTVPGEEDSRPTGRINPVYFFRNAQISKEKEINETFNKEVLAAFKKLWESGKITIKYK